MAELPILLTDTAGLRESADEVEAIGVARATSLIEVADVLVWLGEPVDAPAASADDSGLRPRCDLPGRAIATGWHRRGVVGHAARVLPSCCGSWKRRRGALLPGRGRDRAQPPPGDLICEDAADALARAADVRDAVLIAEELRLARTAFDRLTGRAGVEDVLDALFGRFCLGK